MASQRRREGYLLIDHRNSPGVTTGEVRRAGIDSPVVGAGATFESATITCSHCHRVVVLNPDRSRPRGYCSRCDHYVCDNPGCTRDCTPFSRILDQAQEAAFRAEGQSRGLVLVS